MVDGWICEKCNGTFKILGKDGTMHTCFDCLAAGRIDVHSKNVRDSNIKI